MKTIRKEEYLDPKSNLLISVCVQKAKAVISSNYIL